VPSQAVLLLVLPDPTVSRRVSQVLASLGLRIQTAVDGADALGLVERQAPDLVVSELALPKMDGVSLLQALHRRGPTRRTPVIFLSGCRDAATLLEAHAAGACCCLPLPFGDEELRERVLRALETVSGRES
jgi:CheY-like chemotaxis protein